VPHLEGLESRYAPATVTGLADAGPGSLRQALLDTPAGGTVDFQPGLSGTITLTTGQLTLDKDLTIAGPGASVLTVSGNGAFRVFEVTSGVTAALSGLTIAGGRVTGTNNGGGIYNDGTLTVTASTLSGNAADLGGGIHNSGTLTVTASTFSGNAVRDNGGGILNGGTLTVTASTLNGNAAGDNGGGIGNGDGTVTVTASTLSDNSAVLEGGGISNFGSGTVTVTASTLSGNSASQGGGIGNGEFGTVAVRNTILAGNTAPPSPDVSGLLNSQGHNLVGVGAGGSGYHATDLVGTLASPIDPLLGPLGDYGGPTPTMRPLPASPAVDAGLHFNTVLTDQRGFPRHVDAFADIGAVERQPGEMTTLGGAAPGGWAEILSAWSSFEGRNAGAEGTPPGQDQDAGAFARHSKQRRSGNL
jgi:hypothetical protein